MSKMTTHQVSGFADEESTESSDLAEPASATVSRLTDEQIQEITSLLRAGRRLPPYLFPHLFETAREYELAYSGKARRIDVLAETMAVPLQPVRTFGEQEAGWANLLIFGDNLQVLRRLIQMKQEGTLRNPDGSDGVRLCYIDPPFASQREFTGSRKEKAYTDHVAGAEFVEHLRRRLILIKELLTDDGSLFVHMDTRKAHYMKVILDELFGEGHFRSEIIWKRTHAHSGGRHFGAVHDTLLYYSKSEQYVWNKQFTGYTEDYVEAFFTGIDSDGRRYRSTILTGSGTRTGSSGKPWRGTDPTKAGRHWAIPGYARALFGALPRSDVQAALDALDSMGRILWPEKKAGTPSFKQYLDDMEGVELQDIWTDIPPVGAQATERTGYPTQKPRELVQRIIGTASAPGDIVLDAFVGSGTSLVAADTMPEPRRWIGIDSGKLAIYVTQARLLREAGKRVPDRAFTLYNAGLYDYHAIKGLAWPEYLEFVLQLFQCRRQEESIGGVTFHGFLGDHRVLVFNFKEHPDAKIGRPFVEDLVSLCRGRLGDRCFIVAPALAVEPYEDYLDLEGTRFFFLRIPYSIIAELHKRAFSELRQPTSEAAANAPIDSIGFDFIQTPRVDCKYRTVEGFFEIEIAAFESEAFSVTPSEENIANLAMVMMDYSYEDIFNLDSVHFAEDLASQEWKVRIPREQLGEHLMIVYIDVFGNEHREIKTPADFARLVKKPRHKAAS